MNKSNKGSKMWLITVMMNPQLDLEFRYPTYRKTWTWQHKILKIEQLAYGSYLRRGDPVSFFLEYARDELEIDDEALLDSLKEDLKFLYTAPANQMRKALEKWTNAIKKEVEALFSSVTLRRVTIEEARRLEAEKLEIFAPAKRVFTLKPPQVSGS
eukprot:s549_g4.t2